MLKVYGLNYKKERMDEETRNLYASWLDAKKVKDFEKADKIREELKNRGFAL